MTSDRESLLFALYDLARDCELLSADEGAKSMNAPQAYMMLAGMTDSADWLRDRGAPELDNKEILTMASDIALEIRATWAKVLTP